MTTSTAEIEPAILMLPVIRRLNTNVSMLPVSRQLFYPSDLDSFGQRTWSFRSQYSHMLDGELHYEAPASDGTPVGLNKAARHQRL